jgi:hypothetical protein
MGEAAYNEAKVKGELLEQRLREDARESAECSLGRATPQDFLAWEAAQMIDWLSKERDSLIERVEWLRGQVQYHVDDKCRMNMEKTADVVELSSRLGAFRDALKTVVMAVERTNDCPIWDYMGLGEIQETRDLIHEATGPDPDEYRRNLEALWPKPSEKCSGPARARLRKIRDRK